MKRNFDGFKKFVERGDVWIFNDDGVLIWTNSRLWVFNGASATNWIKREGVSINPNDGAYLLDLDNKGKIYFVKEDRKKKETLSVDFNSLFHQDGILVISEESDTHYSFSGAGRDFSVRKDYLDYFKDSKGRGLPGKLLLDATFESRDSFRLGLYDRSELRALAKPIYRGLSNDD